MSQENEFDSCGHRRDTREGLPDGGCSCPQCCPLTICRTNADPNTEKGLVPSGLALLTVKEACEILRLSKATVYRLVAKRVIPFYRVSGSLRFALKDLEEYVTRRRVESVT